MPIPLKNLTIDDPEYQPIVNSAIGEIALPTLGVTDQFFAVHQIAGSDPVAHVCYRKKLYWVYLHLDDQPYYWVVQIENGDEQLVPKWGFSTPHVRMCLGICSDSLSPEEITMAVNLQPREIRRKGEPISKRSERAYNEHRWFYYPDIPEPFDFDDKLQALLSALLPHASVISKMDARRTIHVGYYEYCDYASGWHLKPETARQLADLDVALDIDLYVSGPELPE